jgi:hypothetical protein
MCIGINSFDDIHFNKFNLNQIFENHEENTNLNAYTINKKSNSFTSGTNKNDDLFNKINKNNIITNENIIVNKTEDSSTEGTSKKKKKQKINYTSQDDTKIQTPKFKQFNYQNNNQSLKTFSKNYYGKGSQIIINPLENIMNITQIIISKKITSLNGLNKEIEELCQIHSLVTPNDIFNLFCNASEIIHRKFFQLTINNYLGTIFYLEEDKDGVIKIEDLYNYFLYIRALKIMLFNGDKKDFFVSKILIEDML